MDDQLTRGTISCDGAAGNTSRVIGIDLGTTNSTVCEITLQPGQKKPSPPYCLNIDQETTQGRYTHVLVPSVVATRGDGIWVGEGAKRLRAAPGASQDENKLWFAETKNDMGVRRTYHKAPPHLKSARAVAAEILKFLHTAALNESEIPISSTVVTVPASFQAAQRDDTIAAAQRAGITLADGELLDEPVAAFLAYLNDRIADGEDFLPSINETKNLLVFDFGGGTCDVAILKLGRNADGQLTITPVTVSRYHRLGGGDLDRAIIHDVLIPQLLVQNGMDHSDLEFEEKRQRIQPALLGVAEALKQKLCNEITRLKKFGRWDKIDSAGVIETQPGAYPIELKDRTLTLQSPKLSAAMFEEVLAPFLDRDLLLPREDEYRVSCSIFAPLEDALLRGSLSRERIDLCLLAGGSTLIPQIQEAVTDYFSQAKILTFSNRDDTQTAVAKGAALHALSLAMTGKGMFQPVCHDDIALQTQRGTEVLVPAGTPLPYPANGGYAWRRDFKAPETVKAGAEGKIRVQIVAGQEQRLLFEEIWKITGPVKKGGPLWLQFRFSENQVLDLKMGKDGDDGEFERTLQNPLTHVVNPNATKSQIEDLEEEMRTGKISRDDMPDKFEKLADLYRKLNQHEKALAYYKKELQLLPDPPAYLLNRMAFCARDTGDRKRAERFFAEADRVAPWSGTFFNWALAKDRWGLPSEALALVEKAIALNDDPPYSVLKARLIKKLGDINGAVALAAAILKRFAPIGSLDEYQLFWYQTGAEIAGEESLITKAEAEVRRRAANPKSIRILDGELPDMQKPPGEDET